MGVGADDLSFDYVNMLDETGLNPVNPSKFTNAETLSNGLIDPALLPNTVAQSSEATPLSLAHQANKPSLWERFSKWLDSVFHMNKDRS